MTKRSLLLSAAALLAPADLRSAAAQPAPPAPPAPLEVVAELPFRPGNPAVTPDGRLLFSLHPLDEPEFKVMEWRDGRAIPFPNPEVSRGLAAVIGLRAGADGIVWTLDMGAPGRAPKFLGWDTRADALHREVPLPGDVLRTNSFLQDFALDQERGIAFVADMTRGDLTGPSDPAIVAVDLGAGAARRLLGGHPSVAPEDVPMVAEGRTASARGPDGRPMELRLGLNPITISPDHAWVYWGPMNGNGLYRARAADLADPNLSAATLASRVERYREKRTSDGITVDGAGNVYVTDVGANAIGVAAADGYRILVQDPRLIWPDGFAFGPDGWLYATVDQLNRHAALNGGTEGGRPPYLIVRTRPLAPGAVGR